MTASDRIRELTEVAETIASAEIDVGESYPTPAEALYHATFDPPTVLALLRVAEALDFIERRYDMGMLFPAKVANKAREALDALAAAGDGQGGGEEGDG